MFRKTLTIVLNIFNAIALLSAAFGLLFGIVKYLILIL